MAFLMKNKDDILRQALFKIASNTDLTATAPGSVMRALVESVTSELGDFYNILDFNFSLQSVATASGRALDLMASLYNVTRKTLSDIATIDASTGSFYFYLDTPYTAALMIPNGTRVFTNDTDFVGTLYQYQTTANVIIEAGRLRAWAPIAPVSTDSVATAGVNTLVSHSFTPPPGVTVRCTNPKPIQAQTAFEDDDSYRTRIIKAVRVAAGGTAEAMRFAGLSISGVRDVTIQSAALGMGSVQAVVVLDNAVVPGPALIAVRDALDAVRPVGVRMFVRQPDLLPVDIDASILLRDITNIDRDNIARRAQIGIIRYINTLLAGQTLIYNQMVQFILDASDFILDASMNHMAINGAEVLRRNYTPRAEELLVPGTVTVNTSN